MTFTEGTTVESLIRDLLCGGTAHYTAAAPCYASFRSRVAEGTDNA